MLPVLLMVVAVLLPTLGAETFLLRQLMLVCVYGLVASGLNLSFGLAGELALGQVAVMAVGAYTTAILISYGVHDVVLLLAASVLVAAVLGLLTGVPSVRLSSWALGITSFFLVLLLPGILVGTKGLTNGLDGLTLDRATFAGVPLASTRALYLLGVVVLATWMLVFRNLVVSRYGLALRTLRQGPTLIESQGIAARRLKLTAYTVGSLPAGAAGCVYALQTGYVSPAPFSLSLVIAIVAATVFAGANSVYGGVAGAALLVVILQQAQAFQNFSTAIYGAFLLLTGLLLPRGVAGLVQRLLARWRVREPAIGTASIPDAAPRPVPDLRLNGLELRVRGASRAFGGVRALQGAEVTALPGQITAIIGSNGAGKTTLLNAISGFVRLDAGTVTLGGEPLTGVRPHLAARAGITRTFQTPEIPDEMTALDVVRSGALRQGRLYPLAAVLRLPAHRRRERQDRERALRLLDLVGLGQSALRPAGDLPLGSRRLLEVARALAVEAKVVMFDEPAAGLDEPALTELESILGMLRSAGATVVLIEHNIPFVLSVADHLCVMELGRTIAEGTPDTVRNDPEVIRSYLGGSGSSAVTAGAKESPS